MFKQNPAKSESEPSFIFFYFGSFSSKLIN